MRQAGQLCENVTIPGVFITDYKNWHKDPEAAVDVRQNWTCTTWNSLYENMPEM